MFTGPPAASGKVSPRGDFKNDMSFAKSTAVDAIFDMSFALSLVGRGRGER
jgi:hypothetical protein